MSETTRALVEVDEEPTEEVYSGGEKRYYHKTDHPTAWGYYHPDEIHTGNAAMLKAAMAQCEPQECLEVCLKRCEGMLKYRVVRAGDTIIAGMGCLDLLDTNGAVEGELRIVFTPPEPEPDTLAERARKLAERMDDVGVKKGTTREIVDILRELAEKLEGGK